MREIPETVKVKPLEWRRHPFYSDDWRADCVIGRYEAGLVHGKFVALLRHAVGDVGTRDERLTAGSGVEQAKAAAQADYEQRILSALTISTDADEAREREDGDEFLNDDLVRQHLAAANARAASMEDLLNRNVISLGKSLAEAGRRAEAAEARLAATDPLSDPRVRAIVEAVRRLIPLLPASDGSVPTRSAQDWDYRQAKDRLRHAVDALRSLNTEAP